MLIKRILTCLVVSLLTAIFVPGIASSDDGRTIIDNSRGGFFMRPFKGLWGDLAAEDGLGIRYDYDAMSSESVKAIHARLQHFELEDHINYSYFPHDLCRAYDADEARQGHQPLWVTAYWQGKHRPVLFSWHWTGRWGATQAINMRDDRFIKFYINNYVRGGLMNPYRQNWWVGLDNCAFRYDLYGVTDDQADPGFHSCEELGISWDQPFPQNDSEWTDAAAYCFDKIKKLAPDIRFMTNEGTMADESKYSSIFSYSDGIVLEGFLAGSEKWGDYDRRDFHDRIYKHVTTVYRDKLQIFQSSHLPATDDAELRTGFCAQMICGGPNRLFGPSDGESTEVDPNRYAAMKNSLGNPVGNPIDEKLDASGTNWLFSRKCEGGWAYFNDSGDSHTVSLPIGEWYDRTGNRVTTLTIGRGQGDLVKDIPIKRCAKPQINPRRALPTTGPLTITLSTEPWTSGTTIRYTTDGSTPTAQSSIYNGGITLKKSCTVKAKSFKAGCADSFEGCADYVITDALPAVSFHLAEDSGSEFLSTYALVKLDHPSAKQVTVAYQANGGTAVNGVNVFLQKGVLEFPPGETFRSFEIPIINNQVKEGSKTLVVSLSNPVNATVGAERTFTYTILDND